jgi:hypothetical protein
MLLFRKKLTEYFPRRFIPPAALLIVINSIIIKVKCIFRCSFTEFSAQVTACLGDLVRHFKTELTETVALRPGFFQNFFRLYRKILFFEFFEKWLRF